MASFLTRALDLPPAGRPQTLESIGRLSLSAKPTGAMDVLYKYVTHERALACIPEVGDGALRATQPAALNDPFECAVATDYFIPDEHEENLHLADTLTRINESNQVTGEDVAHARGEHGSLFTRQLGPVHALRVSWMRARVTNARKVTSSLS